MATTLIITHLHPHHPYQDYKNKVVELSCHSSGYSMQAHDNYIFKQEIQAMPVQQETKVMPGQRLKPTKLLATTSLENQIWIIAICYFERASNNGSNGTWNAYLTEWKFLCSRRMQREEHERKKDSNEYN